MRRVASAIVRTLVRALPARRVALGGTVAVLSVVLIAPGASTALAAQRAAQRAAHSPRATTTYYYHWSASLNSRPGQNGFNESAFAGQSYDTSSKQYTSGGATFQFDDVHSLTGGGSVDESYLYSLGLASPNTITFGGISNGPIPKFNISAVWTAGSTTDTFKAHATSLGAVTKTGNACVTNWNRSASINGTVSFVTGDTVLGNVSSKTWPAILTETRISGASSCYGTSNYCDTKGSTLLTAFRGLGGETDSDSADASRTGSGPVAINVDVDRGPTTNQPAYLFAGMSAIGLPTSSFTTSTNSTTKLTSAKVKTSTQFISGELDFTSAGKNSYPCTYKGVTVHSIDDTGSITDKVTPFIAHFAASTVGRQRITGATTLKNQYLYRTV